MYEVHCIVFFFNFVKHYKVTISHNLVSYYLVKFEQILHNFMGHPKFSNKIDQ